MVEQPATKAQLRAAELIEALWNDAELGPKVQELAAKKYPDVRTSAQTFEPLVSPLKAQLESMSAELKKERDERLAEKKAAEEASSRRTMEQSLEEARKNYNLTEEGFNTMIDRMKSTGNYTDADAAAAWVASKTPPTPVAGPTWAPQDMNMFGSKEQDEKFAMLHKNPEKFFDSEAAEMLRDPDKYVRDTFGAAA